MRRSVPPEHVHTAQQQRADMAAATRVQGVLIPPGTSTVILSYDGPVDVPALYHALGRMIADRDLRGLPVQTIQAQAPATGGVIDTPDATVSEDSDCVFQIPGFDGPTCAGAFEESTGDAHGPLPAVNTQDAVQFDPAPVAGEDSTPKTPLEHLRAHGPATAAQFADTRGVTRQKAALELAALVGAGHALKDGKLYTATPHPPNTHPLPLTAPSPTASSPHPDATPTH